MITNCFLRKFHDKPRIKYKKLKESDFENQKDQLRLSMFTNMTKDMLKTDWQFCLQSDEEFYMNQLMGQLKRQ